MGVSANPPPQSRLPAKLAEDDDLRFYFTALQEDLYRLWLRSGGGTDQVSDITDRVDSAQGNNQAQVNEINNRLGSGDNLTSDETGFTVDLDTLSVDMTESIPNDLPEGEDGTDGTDGTNGTNGTNGEGVVAGGTTGQVLSKIDSTDFNTEWTTPGGGGSVAWGAITGTLSDQTDLQTVLDLKIENLTSFDTGDLSEGSNLYYTDVRVAANSAVTANTAKVTNATHTGDVTGSTALTAQSVMVTGQSTVTAVSGDFVLISDTSDSGNLKKVNASDFLGGGGFTPTIFQALKSGTQATTGAAVDLTGWAADIASADISFNTTTGVVTFDTTGTYMISCYVLGEDVAGGNNRCELNMQMQLDTGGGFANVAGALDSQYAVRNNTQDQGSAQFNNYALQASATDSVKLQVFDIGIPLDILSNRARITILRVA